VDRDGIIEVMSDILANKIAAGEVVQRPASVVKELVENAIDAGATRVHVITKSAGRDLIQVVDNGSGMSAADATACFHRHATSKIRAIEDLERIRTLGFRGEALASIAAVSRVELRTRRQEDAVGSLVRIEGGVTRTVEPCAAPAGTNVAVRNLFFNVPARRNFLKSAATELKHIVETVQFLALSNPSIAFELHHDQSEVLAVSVGIDADSVRQRISAVFGDAVGRDLVGVSESTSYLTMHGFVGRPERHRKSPSEQFLFVNGRIVRSRYLAHAVKAAYENMLPEAAYPFFVLFIDLDPQHVDVNVHPTKAEIKFDDERGVYGFVKAVVKKALGMADLIPQVSDETGFPGFMPSVFTSLDEGDNRISGHERERIWPAFDGASSAAGATPDSSWADAFYGPDEVTASGGEARLERRLSDGEVRFWQIADYYVVTPLRSGLLVIDPSGAHQRIIYEHALASLDSGRGLTQQLLFPQTIEFPAGDFDLLCEIMPQLRSVGFEVEEFGGRSVIVRGIPADVKQAAAEHLLHELLEEFRNGMRNGSVSREENLARSVAKRGAVRPGTRMALAEMSALVDQLFLCSSPYTCPAGRPTMIRVSVEELARRFGR
jgi:DNA mismatch repair protein MutL